MASLQQVSDEPQCRILVCGETVVGKSSLINFILGDSVCEVSGPGEAVFPRTKKVEGYSVIANDVLVTIYDSPGLLEGQSSEQEYLTEMHKRCRDVDLVLYCHDMTTARWIPAEIDAIRLLTAKFGASLWNKAIFVLTRANMIQSPNPMREEEKMEYFQNWIASVTRRLRTAVQGQLLQAMHGKHAENDDQSEAGEIQNLVDSIPIVPTGSAAKQILPGGKNFIGDLLVTCMQRIANPHLSAIFTQAMNDEEPLIDATEFDKEGHLYGFISERGGTTRKDLQCEAAPYRKYIVRKIGPCTPTQIETRLTQTELYLQLSQTETELHSTDQSQELHPTDPSQIEQQTQPIESEAETTLTELSQAGSTLQYEPSLDSVTTQLPITNHPSQKKAICHWAIIGALVGAVVGSAFIPVLGTFIGAVIGAIIGSIEYWLVKRRRRIEI